MNVRLAVAVPVAWGAKVTVKPADCPAARVAGREIPESENSLLLAAAEEIVTAAPLAARVPFSAAVDPTVTLPKLSVAGETDSCPGVVPVPESAMLSGELDASDTRDKVPFTAPAVAGANFTVKVRLWPAASVVGAVSPVIE